ncbi:MAG: hypothetical protein A2Y38_22610 [Spirochaetes bacterium GWB1_59_5]|nr:MAG: hypothetical protein A2Y38_22610 [Spirochaetes bacterium GWB1_59_5]
MSDDNEHAIGSGIGAGTWEMLDEEAKHAVAVKHEPPSPASPPHTFEDTSIEELRFEGVNTLATLRLCNVRTVRDIEQLGCTGARKYGLLAGDIKALRLGLGGSGVGLPCFVPITRYCLGHDTIGGLQDGQKQWHPERVEGISRALTPAEKGRIELIEASRRVKEKNPGDRLTRIAEALSGRELPPGFSTEDDAPELPPSSTVPIKLPAGVTPIPYAVEQLWVCPEHKKTNWACRYCVAQAIVEGPLESIFDIRFDGNDHDYAGLTPAELPAKIEKLDEDGHVCVDVYAHVARFTRRLAREE